jgi:pimeloyl-ACP methyl ester carboxylesterase
MQAENAAPFWDFVRLPSDPPLDDELPALDVPTFATAGDDEPPPPQPAAGDEAAASASAAMTSWREDIGHHSLFERGSVCGKG